MNTRVLSKLHFQLWSFPLSPKRHHHHQLVSVCCHWSGMQKYISGQLVSYRVAFIRFCGLDFWFCSSLVFLLYLCNWCCSWPPPVSSSLSVFVIDLISSSLHHHQQQQQHRNSALKMQLRPLGIAFKWHFVVGAFPQSTRTEGVQENKTNDLHQQHQPTKETVLGRKLLGNSINH